MVKPALLVLLGVSYAHGIRVMQPDVLRRSAGQNQRRRSASLDEAQRDASENSGYHPPGHSSATVSPLWFVKSQEFCLPIASLHGVCQPTKKLWFFLPFPFGSSA